MNPDDLGKCWERDWLRYLLSGVCFREIRDGSHSAIVDKAIVVDNSLVPAREPYYRKLHDSGARFALVHLSDEFYNDSVEVYSLCDLVLRNYWSPLQEDKGRVMAFPLGYKTGLRPTAPLPPAGARHYSWSFAGNPSKSTRKQMLDNMTQVPGGHTFFTKVFNDPNGLSTSEYQKVLLDSVFVPCPAGNGNLDSFRVYEALECGSIPIVECRPGFDYFALFLGEHPFITVGNWNEVVLLLQGFLSSPEKLEEKRKSCERWWAAHKASLLQTLAAQLDNRVGMKVMR
jgi:hypothetical protein